MDCERRQSEADSGHHSGNHSGLFLGNHSIESLKRTVDIQQQQLTPVSPKFYGSWGFHDGRLIGQGQAEYNSNCSSNNNSPQTSQKSPTDNSSTDSNDDKRQSSDRSSDDPENCMNDFKDYRGQSNSGSRDSSNYHSNPGSGSSSSNDLSGSASNLFLGDPRTQMGMEQLQRQQQQEFQQHNHQEFQESQRLVKKH